MKRNNTLIELTPLLDVILLILFLVLVQSAERIEEVHTELREAYEAELEAFKEELALEVEEFMSDIEEELASLRNIADDFSSLRLGLEEDTSTIILSLTSDSNNRDVRSITVETAGNTTEIGLSWDTVARENASIALASILSEHINNFGTVTFIVFQYNSSDIFATDHNLVRLIIHNLRQEHSQMFFAEMDMR